MHINVRLTIIFGVIELDYNTPIYDAYIYPSFMALLPKDLLTAVVPFISITPQMQMWIPVALNAGISVVLVHDRGKTKTSSGVYLEDREIIRDLASSGATLVEGNFGSPGAARNGGLEAVTSVWVTFWDSDDIPLVMNAVRAVNDSSSQNFDYLVGDFIARKAAKESQSIEIVRDRNISTIATHPGIWRFFFQKESIGKLRFPDLVMGEDQIFLANYGLLSHKGCFLQYETYEYFIENPGSLTSSRDSQKKVSQALIRILDDFKNLDRLDKKFASIIILKLIYSSLKYGDRTSRKYVMLRMPLMFKQVLIGTMANALTKIISIKKYRK